MNNDIESGNEGWTAEDETVFMHRLIGFEVLDGQGTRVGVTDAVFEEDAGQREFLGIRLGVMGFSRLHIVPAQFAEIDEHTRIIRLPFTREVVERAPAVDADFEFVEEEALKVYDYYRLAGFPFEEFGIHETI